MRLGMLLLTGVSLALFTASGGCRPPAAKAPSTATEHDHDHDHGEGHDHGHSHADHGPHDGHLVELNDANYHAEWTHDDDTGRIRVYLLDGEAKQEVPIAAERLTIRTQLTGGEASTYELTAVDPQGDPARSAVFEITDPELLVQLKLGADAARSELEIPLDGRTLTGVMEHHEHDHAH